MGHSQKVGLRHSILLSGLCLGVGDRPGARLAQWKGTGRKDREANLHGVQGLGRRK